MDLTTTYLGLALRTPLVASASPLSKSLASLRRLEDAGASAIVMHSLFEEQIHQEMHQLDHYLNYGVNSFAEALDYFPDLGHYNLGSDAYLTLISEAKAALDVPIIGSLNGVSPGGWTNHAQKIQEAGADALELNIYYVAADVDVTGAAVEQMYLEVIRAVRESVSIPVAVKMNPYFSSMANMARQMAAAGADALVLFNRFYQPDFDLERLEVVPHLVLSSSHELRLPLRWVAMLHGRVPVDLAITTGVHTHEDVLEGMMAGAKVTMVASELLRHGVERIGQIEAELVRWMTDHEYVSIRQMQGSMSQLHVADPAAFERANYMKVLQSWQQDPTSVLLR
jgi:dihydroorotate dehydrogenase (fumarate)